MGSTVQFQRWAPRGPLGTTTGGEEQGCGVGGGRIRGLKG